MRVLTFSLGALRTNTYFCFDESGACVVIDPGMDGEGIAEKLASKGLHADYIFLTHGHFDHSQGVRALKAATGAKVVIHREDALMLSDPGKNSAGFYYRGDLSAFPTSSADLVVEQGDEIRVGSMTFSVLHTPGHTPGSACFVCDQTVFCGDTVFAYGYGRYDLWGGDRKALSDSLKKIASLEGEYKLCPGHGNSASLERIRGQILDFSNELM
ncbi:MAG: MBL fold metallo-hydrolase [Clostridia bacterium]|nr:MBL fold metallo-hydrolase [Clostridia bacterium]